MTPFPVFPLDGINLDASLRVRVDDNADVIRDYAEAMQAGAVFPPVVLYLVDGEHVVVDGRHRIAAAQQIGRTTIAAEVYVGTIADAAWAGAGANRTHGQQPTLLDKTYCVQLLLNTCPEKMQHEIAVQVGCSDALVSKIAIRNKGATGVGLGLRGRELVRHTRREAVREMVEKGVSATEIRRQLRAHSTVIAEVRRELGQARAPRPTEEMQARRVAKIRELAAEGYTANEIGPLVGVHPDTVRVDLRKHQIVARRRSLRTPLVQSANPRALTEARAQEIARMLREGQTFRAIQAALRVGHDTIAAVRDQLQIDRGTPRSRVAQERRLEQIRTMAADGLTTRQIAGRVKLGRDRVREIAKAHGIDIRADRVVGNTHRHNATRIVSRIVQDAENLTAAAELIVFEELDRKQVPDWIASLLQSREQLSAFIRRLMQEQSHEAEAVSV